MAHNLEIRNGKASCYLYKVPGWHSLGQVSEIALPASEVMKAAGMDFEVEKQDIFVGPSLIPIAGKKATIRTDNNHVLGIVSDSYTVVQFREVFDWIRGLGEWMNDLTYESAFILGKGERFAVGIRMNDEFNFKGDKTFPYLYCNGSFDGLTQHSIVLGSVRELCANTLRLAEETAGVESSFIRHSKNMNVKLESSKQTIIQASVAWKKHKETLLAMSKKKVEDSMVDKLIAEVFAKPGKDASKAAKTRFKSATADIHAIYNGPTGKLNFGNNLHVCWNAISEYLDHESSVKSKQDGKDLSETEIAQNRFENNMFGITADKKDKLFKAALALI